MWHSLGGEWREVVYIQPDTISRWVALAHCVVGLLLLCSVFGAMIITRFGAYHVQMWCFSGARYGVRLFVCARFLIWPYEKRVEPIAIDQSNTGDILPPFCSIFVSLSGCQETDVDVGYGYCFRQSLSCCTWLQALRVLASSFLFLWQECTIAWYLSCLRRPRVYKL